MNVKKLDINFDSDDFFNQFDPATIVKQQEIEAAERAEKEKIKAKKAKDTEVLKTE